jgi:anaphase-promoting complex subunit 1
LLQSSRVQSATSIRSLEWNEHEWMLMQQELFRATAIRTLSISFGRAALFYSARNPLTTEKYPIPKINLMLLLNLPTLAKSGFK